MYHCHLLPISLGYDHVLPGIRLYLSTYLIRLYGPLWEEYWREPLRNAEVLLLETPQHILAGAVVFSVSSDVMFIHLAFMHPEYRGSMLIMRALRTIDVLAGARGCRVVRCYIDNSNERSLSTCTAIGFRIIEADDHGHYLQAASPLVQGRAANRFSAFNIVEPIWRRQKL